MKPTGQLGRVEKGAASPASAIRQAPQQVRVELRKTSVELKKVRGILLEAVKGGQSAASVTEVDPVLFPGVKITEYKVPVGRFSEAQLKSLRSFGFQVTQHSATFFKHSDGRISNDKSDLEAHAGVNDLLNLIARNMPRDLQRAFTAMFGRGFLTSNAIARSGAKVRHVAVKLAAHKMRNPTSEEYARFIDPQQFIAMGRRHNLTGEQIQRLHEFISKLSREDIWLRQ